MFDRPGFYRYHSKNTDTEYGMVKEEVNIYLSIYPSMYIYIYLLFWVAVLRK